MTSGDYKTLLRADRKEFTCLPLYFIINLHKLQFCLEAKCKLIADQAGIAQSSVLLIFEPLPAWTDVPLFTMLEENRTDELLEIQLSCPGTQSKGSSTMKIPHKYKYHVLLITV